MSTLRGSRGPGAAGELQMQLEDSAKELEPPVRGDSHPAPFTFPITFLIGKVNPPFRLLSSKRYRSTDPIRSIGAILKVYLYRSDNLIGSAQIADTFPITQSALFVIEKLHRSGLEPKRSTLSGFDDKLSNHN